MKSLFTLLMVVGLFYQQNETKSSVVEDLNTTATHKTSKSSLDEKVDCAFGLAQKGAIDGRLLDDLGHALAFANVALYKDKDLIKDVVSDIDGRYLVSEVDAGTYDVEATLTGYSTKRITGVQVGTGIIRLDFTMTQAATLDEVIVIGFKVPLIQVSESHNGGTLTGEQIKNLPSKEIGRIVGAAAGVATSESENYIKGSPADASVFMMDGIRYDVATPPQSKDETKFKADKNINKTNMKSQYDMALNAINEETEIINTSNVIDENKFVSTSQEKTSTFSIDVDAASYANMRGYISRNQLPPAGVVRIEEMINYFDYDYPAPYKEPFEMYTEVGECPWNSGHQLVHIGLQGMEIDKSQLPPSNMVFLIDVSGSMSSHNKLPLLQKGFNLLVDQLRPEDQISIVTYAGSAGIILPPTKGNQKNTIKAAVDNLRSGGSTAGAQGIITAYDLASEHFIKNGNNRVILATDGDFNVGQSSDAALVQLIDKKRKSGVYLSVLGFGQSNYQDVKMQKLADSGNGNHYYIDQIAEAQKVLVSEFGGTLFTIAKDVKIQIDFNPDYVSAYRLIGYENRMLANQDFADDTKDAGELGAGHTVTALYEIVPNGVQSSYVQSTTPKRTSLNHKKKRMRVLDIRFRYKKPDEDKSRLIKKSLMLTNKRFNDASDNFKWSASVAEFGLILRNSEFKGSANYGHILSTSQSSKGDDKNGYRAEFIHMVRTISSVASK